MLLKVKIINSIISRRIPEVYRHNKVPLSPFADYMTGLCVNRFYPDLFPSQINIIPFPPPPQKKKKNNAHLSLPYTVLQRLTKKEYASTVRMQIACPASKLSGTFWRLGAGGEKESLQLCLWNLNICIENVDVKC